MSLNTVNEIRKKVLSLATAIGLGLLFLYQHRNFFHDDTYITLRYVQQFLGGNGIVWNTGETVEGYTNFLFLLLVSLIGSTGLDLVLATRLVNVTALVLTALLVARIAGHRGWLFGLPAAFVLGSAPLAIWSMGGMEAPFLGLLGTAGAGMFLRARESGFDLRPLGLSALILALAVLARPDGLIFVVVSLAFLLHYRQTWKQVLLFLGVITLVLVPYLVWKWGYYGSLVPNTFYAKSAAALEIERMWYASKYLANHAKRPPFLFLWVLVALGYLWRRKAFNGGHAYLLSMAGAYIAYVIWVGADHMPGHRFVVPVIPLLAAFVFRAIPPAPGLLEAWKLLALHSLSAVLLAFQIPALEERTKRPDPAAFVGRIIGGYIAENWPTGSSVALNTAGSIPYYSPGNSYIDMLGLNDRQIARRPVADRGLPWQKIPGHRKGDGAYVLSREPDYIIAGPAQGASIDQPYFLSDLEMAEDPRFERMYTREQIQIDVRRFAGYRHYLATRTGALEFTYYRRRVQDVPTE